MTSTWDVNILFTFQPRPRHVVSRKLSSQKQSIPHIFGKNPRTHTTGRPQLSTKIADSLPFLYRCYSYLYIIWTAKNKTKWIQFTLNAGLSHFVTLPQASYKYSHILFCCSSLFILRLCTLVCGQKSSNQIC